MNIALFASAFYPSLGGVEELCRQLALELMRQGHRVIVLTNRWPRDLPASETIDGITVYRLPFRLPEGSAKAAMNYHLTHKRIEREMLTILRAHQIDILHVQCVSSNAHYAMIAQERLRLPLVVTLQGELTMDANQIFQKSPQAQEILRRVLDRAQVITGCSCKTLRDGEEFYGKPFGARGRVIFNGVNLADFAMNSGAPGSKDGLATEIAEDTEGGGGIEQRVTSNEQRATGDGGEVVGDRLLGTGDGAGLQVTEGKGARGYGLQGIGDRAHEVVGYGGKGTGLAGQGAGRGYIFALGRMAKQKGFDVLIRAYALIWEQRKSSAAETFLPDLVIAGDGPELEPLKSLVRELELSDHIHFPGRADRRQVASLLRGCEYFVLSSPAEPFGIVILEAMAAGAPVIAVNHAGPAEIIADGVNGLLAARSEPGLLAAAMQRLSGDVELRKRLSAGGRARAAEFAWPKIAQQYVEAYATAISMRRDQ